MPLPLGFLKSPTWWGKLSWPLVIPGGALADDGCRLCLECSRWAQTCVSCTGSSSPEAPPFPAFSLRGEANNHSGVLKWRGPKTIKADSSHQLSVLSFWYQLFCKGSCVCNKKGSSLSGWLPSSAPMLQPLHTSSCSPASAWLQRTAGRDCSAAQTAQAEQCGKGWHSSL